MRFQLCFDDFGRECACIVHIHAAYINFLWHYTNSSGWERQLNLISWNDHEPKYDIRDWSPDGSKMGKGISMTKEDLIALKGILDDMEL
ncbi:Uncharacterized conserved protein UCP037246 [human gut metagenome]|uniref:Uncharacterized conserved protein UCP037246 n=1 Tax=human gut metagenome TaxID=408170 RepID=K1SV40_9ZZZZ